MNRSEPLDVEHRLGESLRGFLGQIVADAALDEAVRVESVGEKVPQGAAG